MPKIKTRPASARINSKPEYIEHLIDPAYNIESILLANETLIAIRNNIEDNRTIQLIKSAILN